MEFFRLEFIWLEKRNVVTICVHQKCQNTQDLFSWPNLLLKVSKRKTTYVIICSLVILKNDFGRVDLVQNLIILCGIP
jgi:hypothetical protein